MRCIFSKSSDPYFNLATEEYLLKNSPEEVFLSYINEPCIVAGKHQNLLSEINLPFVIENKIKPARRLSGGGTVYQDLNNLNFSFIHNCKNPEKTNFKTYTLPVLEALGEMGLNVVFSDRNDLLINGLKVSGNAMHIWKTRVLSHGTLLFNSDLKQLSSGLKNNPERYTDRSIKSVRSKVTNLSDFMPAPKTMAEFCHELISNIVKNMADSTTDSLSIHENESIEVLSREKFESWEWIYGYSPKYTYCNQIQLADQLIEFSFTVEKGIIREVKTNLDAELNAELFYFFTSLIDTRHDYPTILEKLPNENQNGKLTSLSLSMICQSLF